MLAGKLGDLYGRKIIFLEPAFAGAVGAGWLEGPFDDLRPTEAGTAESDKVVAAPKACIGQQLEYEVEQQSVTLDETFEALARSILSDDAPVLTAIRQ